MANYIAVEGLAVPLKAVVVLVLVVVVVLVLVVVALVRGSCTSGVGAAC